jgi:hypothetical protein
MRLGGALGKTKGDGGIFQSEPREKTQVDQPGGVGILHGELGERLVQSDQLFITSIQSDFDLVEIVRGSGSGKLTRRPVFWVGSATVKRSLANGPPAGLPRSNKGWTALSRQRSSKASSHSREAGGCWRIGRRRVGVEVRDLKNVWIHMRISLVRAINRKP